MKHSMQISESIGLGTILALSGGFMDAYSYIERGKVFANAQTGNMLLFGVNLSEGNYQTMLNYLFPVLAFALGIALADTVRTKEPNLLHWRQISVLTETLILIAVSFFPTTLNLPANSLTSFACGIQVESFRKIHGQGIATTMCIGNLRSGTENLHHYLHTKERKFLDSSLLYYGIIICFIIGAVIGNAVVRILHEKAILGCSFLLFVTFLIMFIDREKELRENIKGAKTKIVAGMEGLIECAIISEADIVVAAVVGMIGIRPVMEAIKAGKDIAFANKETLVTAGHIIMPMIKKYGVKLLPVDSEHAAIFQSLNGENHADIDKILLTASGGPFRGKKREELKNIQVEDALKHPNWSMGRKITIDSSTMVNKGLEVIEAKWLFNVSCDDIQVVVQPKSVIHSMVQFKDGAVIAQLGTPDMKLPIQYALTYPDRRYLPGERLDFWKMSEITFEKPDMETFKGLKLAYDACREGGSMPTVLNAANEKAVALFLEKKIAYLQISDIIEECMCKHTTIKEPSLEEILEIEQNVYSYILAKYNDNII